MKHAEIIKQLTLEEKCSLLSGRDIWHTNAIARLGIPSIMMSDGPSGLRKQAGDGDHLGLNESIPATCWPSSATVAASWNTALAETVGAAIGREAAAQGVDVLLGPGLNTKRSPLCGRNFEYYSEDPYLAGKLAAAYICGVQSEGVAACPKHFAANSQEYRRMVVDSVVDERTLRELYLTNFEIAVKEGHPGTIMSAYNPVNGVYANENAHLLDEILVREWGFEGAVITDWGGDNDFVAGIRAGSSLEMPGTGGDSARQLMRAVQSGDIDESIVDERVDALLGLVLAAGGKRPAEQYTDAHHLLARRAAEESVVLLRNEGDTLPLSKETRVAVIGDFAARARYQGAGSSLVNPTMLENTLELLGEYFPNNVGFTQGFLRADKPSGKLLRRAKRLAKKADAVLLYMGLPEVFEVEGQDREHMRLPQNQIDVLEALVKINPNVIVVLSEGSAVELPFVEKCRAVLLSGLGGQAAASALLRVLTGEVNPSGSLAETYPIRYEDMPVSRYYPGKHRTAEYREGLNVGYRYTETAGVPVRFPFGFGLSYTTFEYSDLVLDEKSASFTVANTGDRAGFETAQLYVGLRNPVVYRPALELKGFEKQFIGQGESRRFTIPLDDMTFRYFSAATGRFETEGGAYVVKIGRDIRDVRLTGELSIEGTTLPETLAADKARSVGASDAHAVGDEEFTRSLGRPIPDDTYDETALLGINDTLGQMYYAKSGLARFAYRILLGVKNRSVRKGKPNLNILFLINMPVRGIAKNSCGAVTMAMAESMLSIINGHFFRGLGGLIKGFFARKK